MKTDRKKTYLIEDTYVELHSNREMLIEGRGTLTEYSPERITVMLKKFYISVSGLGLGLGAMNEERISIVGKIQNIAYREKNE